MINLCSPNKRNVFLVKKVIIYNTELTLLRNVKVKNGRKVKNTNHNIEVINEKLWGVKYSHLDFIKEIKIEPNLNILLSDEFARVTPEGLIILNKDHRGYYILKEWFPRIMNKKDRQLKKELANSKLLKNKTEWQELYVSILNFEFQRRLLKRKGMR